MDDFLDSTYKEKANLNPERFYTRIVFRICLRGSIGVISRSKEPDTPTHLKMISM
ncbi:8047_t:CDS:2 [Acaulospora morrowiae]|uniref:8047_t:CDS:1 n=1 Tax=Acaulospora morrowiae TaxID=94023 RepID=A0A9N8V5Q0_9GLOM|nr:8047_t:CDS:2 [Acaulospora morrowiae]